MTELLAVFAGLVLGVIIGYPNYECNSCQYKNRYLQSLENEEV